MRRKSLLVTLIMMLLFVGHSFSQSETIDYSIDTGDVVVSVDEDTMTLQVIDGTEVKGLKEAVNVITTPAAIDIYETSGGAIKIDTKELYDNNVLEISSNEIKESYIIEMIKPIEIEGYSRDLFISAEDTRILIKNEIEDHELDESFPSTVTDLLECNLDFNYLDEELTLEVINSSGNIVMDEDLQSGMYLKVSNGSLEKRFQIFLTSLNFDIQSTSTPVEIDYGNTYINYPYDYLKEDLKQSLSGNFEMNETLLEDLKINREDEIVVTQSIDGSDWQVSFDLQPYIKLDSDDELVVYEDIDYIEIDKTDNPKLQAVIDLFQGIDQLDQESIKIYKDETVVNEYNVTFDRANNYKIEFKLASGEIFTKYIHLVNPTNDSSENVDESDSDNTQDSSGEYDNSDSIIEYIDIHFLGETSKVFKNELAFLKANTAYEVIVEAYDINGETVQVDNVSINVSADFGTNPMFEVKDGKYYLKTAYVSGGYGDSYGGSIQVNDYKKKFKVNTYKGKLLLLNLTDFEGNPYDGRVKYSISYALETGDSNSFSGTGSISGGVAYNGVLPIPIQGDYIGVNNAYIIAAPKYTIAMANTKFIDLTNALSESVNKDVVELENSIAFQAPEFKGTVYKRDGLPWYDIHTNLRYKYIGDEYDIYAVSSVSAINENQFVLASLGEDFSNTFDLEIEGQEPGQVPVVQDNVSISLFEKDFVSPNPEVQGRLLDPRTDDLIVNGQGRDTRVNVSGSGNFNYQTNNAKYLLTGFENGKTYQIYAYIEPGDFYDENLTDSETYEFVYDDTKDEIILNSVDTNKIISMVKDSSGIFQLDLYATESIIRGRVFTGNENSPMTTHTDVSLYNEAGELVSSSYTTSSQFVDEDDNQGYFMLGGATIEPGTYYIEVDAPIDSINYSDYRQKVELPLAEDETFNIILPESKIYGNIVGDSIFESVRNVYVNIFDAFGNYIKNGRVRVDGKFAVSNLDAGRYYSKVFVSPYSALSEDYTSSKKVAFEVVADEKVNFDVPLTKKMYTGTLLNNDRENWIRIFDANMNEVEAIKSDADGSYNLPLLDDGAYFIKAYGNNKYDSILEKIKVVNGELSGLDNELSLSDEPNIQLNIVNATGDQLEGEVIIYNEDKKFITFAKSFDGKATIGGLISGTYYVEVKPLSTNYVRSEFIEITLEDTLKEKTVELSEASIVGTINADTGWVYLLRDNKIVSTSEIFDGNFSLPILQTDVTYEVYGVPEDQGIYKTERKEITSLTESVNLVASEVSAIRGTVSKDGQLVQGQVLYLYDENDQAVDSVKTDIFGEFYFNNISSGNYKLVLPTENDAIIEAVEYSDQEEVIDLTL